MIKWLYGGPKQGATGLARSDIAQQGLKRLNKSRKEPFFFRGQS